MKRELVSTSKFLSLILRHKPETVGLRLDGEGWVSVQELLAAARASGRDISRELLDEVVFTNDKKRFALSPDGEKIRANQGHSVAVDLALSPRVPPERLYHGTVERFLEAIISGGGLRRMQRQHVHLSATVETARSVGRRRGRPVILAVDSGRMSGEGHRFYLSQNGVWLTEAVPWKYITPLEEASFASEAPEK